MKFTALELQVLTALHASSAGNGHDFGFIDDAQCAVGRAQLSGVVSSLVQKGVIEVHDTVTTDSGTWTQFTFRDGMRATVEAAQTAEAVAAAVHTLATPAPRAIGVRLQYAPANVRALIVEALHREARRQRANAVGWKEGPHRDKRNELAALADQVADELAGA